jgi:hypothetical protein
MNTKLEPKQQSSKDSSNRASIIKPKSSEQVINYTEQPTIDLKIQEFENIVTDCKSMLQTFTQNINLMEDST